MEPLEARFVCKTVGDTRDSFVVSITIDERAMVYDLQKAVKAENQSGFKHADASRLHFFLTKWADGAWMKSDSDDAMALRKGKATSHIEELLREDNELFAELSLPKVLADMEELSCAQIHVLVVVQQLSPADPELKQLHEVLFRHAILAAGSSTSTRTSDDFKMSLVSTYHWDMGVNDKGAPRCGV
ncbi:unnamed protein product [Phytophthora lilii]|uniref:Unnamed protein product n=1 Tax=Phytophthora lilii TaxID=2077276 RepID=A0A9W6U280_9STRA|nr:unnamed protein product [Phytophthora lilii]